LGTDIKSQTNHSIQTSNYQFEEMVGISFCEIQLNACWGVVYWFRATRHCS